MSIWMFVKTFGDLCLYFSVVSALPGLFAYDFSYLWPILLGATGVAMGDMLSTYGKPWLRLLCLILPAAGFLLADTTIEYMILLPSAVYPGILLLRDMNDLEYYSFRGQFKTCIIGWVLYFLVICLLTYFENATQPWRETLDFHRSLVCGLLFLLSGVLLLRQLRMGREYRRSIRNTAQLGIVLGATGGVLLIVVALDRILQTYATSVLEMLKKGLLYLITAPLIIITQIVSWTLAQEFAIENQLSEGEQVQYTEAPVEGALPGPVLGTVEQMGAEERFPWWLAVLILAVMLLILVLLARTYRKRKDVRQIQEETLNALPEKKKREISQHSNRWKVRQIYRSFLKYLRSQGVVLRKYHTSADMLARLPAGIDRKAAVALRQSYLVARYDSKREITSEQLKIAREAMKQIRNGKETNR